MGGIAADEHYRLVLRQLRTGLLHRCLVAWAGADGDQWQGLGSQALGL